jgi:hypothetical protein
MPEEFRLEPGHRLGRRAFVYTEGGPGDELRFASLYRELTALFPDLTLTCEPRLESLMVRSFPHIPFLPIRRSRPEIRSDDYDTRSIVPTQLLANALNNRAVEEIERADFACSVLETLADLRPDRDSFPRQGAYLKPDPALVAEWAQRVRQASGGRPVHRIAICWRSMLRSPARQPHYLSAADMAPLARLENAEFWSVQTGVTDEELSELRQVLPNVQVPDLDLKDDFEGVAALFVNMDHVVAPFITQGEFAGALGVPTTLLANTHTTTWRRNADGSDVWHSSAATVFGDPVGDRAALMRAAVERIEELLYRPQASPEPVRAAL